MRQYTEELWHISVVWLATATALPSDCTTHKKLEGSRQPGKHCRIIGPAEVLHITMCRLEDAASTLLSSIDKLRPEENPEEDPE